jgi:hypothetical protein
MDRAYSPALSNLSTQLAVEVVSLAANGNPPHCLIWNINNGDATLVAFSPEVENERTITLDCGHFVSPIYPHYTSTFEKVK